MRIELTIEVRATLEREAHVQAEFASSPGVVSTPTATSFTARAAAARAMIAKLDAAALEAFSSGGSSHTDAGPSPI